MWDSDTPIKERKENLNTGDSWPAALLRLKSFEELHKLWFVLLKEKNLLMGEQAAARAHNINMEGHGRLKKVKMSMKRILTVLSRREIHQQCLRAKEMLKKQEERESLETRRFKLEEQIKMLEHKIERLGNTESLQKAAWKTTLQKYRADHEQILIDLKPLRKATMYMLTPDWRYERKYSDLPGRITWKKQYIRALEESIKHRKPIRFY